MGSLETAYDELMDPEDEDHWLHKMQGYLDWKIIAPRLNNPYEKAIPDRQLFQMSQKPEKIRQVLKVRCLCDGHEVLRIDNLETPILTTEHPCLTNLPRGWIMAHLEEIGLEDEIERTIERLQREIKEELGRRESRAVRDISKVQAKTVGQIKAERDKERKAKKEAEDAKAAGPRIIYRKG